MGFFKRFAIFLMAVSALVFPVSPAIAAGPGVFPAPATGLLWLNVITGEFSQWDLNGTNVVRGPTTWALNCAVQTECTSSVAEVGELDGHPGHDLLTRRPYSSGMVLHTDAKASGMAHWTAACGPECQNRPLGVRDFNKDGNQDVLWYAPGYAGGHPVVSLFDGHGSSRASMTVNEVCSWDCAKLWTPVAVGDVNSDGFNDLLWWNTDLTSPGWLHAWLLNASGDLVGKMNLSWTCAGDCIRQRWNPIGLGDINGDGTQDLMWRNDISGAVATWLLDGHGTVLRDQYLDWGCDNACYQTWRPVGIVDPEHRRPIHWP